MYEMQPGSDIFVIKKINRPIREVITRVYTLKHATVSNAEMLKTLEEGGGDSSSESEDSGSAMPSSSGEEGEESASEGILSAIQSIISQFGNALEDPRTNSIIVTDVPSQFPVIDKTIAKLDVPVPQILIEVEMLDISKNTADLLGVKMGSTLLSFSGAQRGTLYPWDQNKILNSQKWSFPEGEEYTAGTIDATGLTATLQFLKTITDTKNLANPKILTLNNQTATIEISTNEAIGVVTSTGGSEGIVTQNVEAERVQTGVFLRVTPQANVETGEITMAIIPKVIEARAGGSFGGQTFKDPEERGTKSILRVKNGETIYLGGLKKIDNQKTITKVPVLGDLPFIGGAFRHTDSSEEERELIIFITPRIIPDQYQLSQNIITPDQTKREQNYPVSKLKQIERALLITEQQQKRQK